MADRSMGPAARSRAAGALALAATLALGVAALAPAATFAQDDAVAVNAVTGDLGTYLTDAEGKTLYFFTRDVAPGVSVCEGDCLVNWPALAVGDGQTLVAGDGVTGVLSAIARSDGSMQATYDGRPLYTFAGDAAAGETNGQGLNGVWFVALEDGSSPPNPPEEGAPSPGPVGLTLEAASTDLGTFLTGADGRTLYFFKVDTAPGVSECADDCLTAWPPATVGAGETVAAGEGVAGVIGMITATDGSPQVTYDGRPLYYFQGDTEAGQTNGQGIGDVWFVADVSGAVPAAPAPAESMAPTESAAA